MATDALTSMFFEALATPEALVQALDRIIELEAQLAAVQPWAEVGEWVFGDWVRRAAAEELTEDEDVCLICGDTMDHPNVNDCPIPILLAQLEADNVSNTAG